MEMLDLARNLLNMVIIDADGEDVGVQSLSVAGVKDILDNACAMLSAVSHIPQTRLLGVPRRARMPLERVTLRITRNSSGVSKTVTSAITPVPSLS